MEKEKLKDQALHSILQKMCTDEFPVDLNNRIMQKVYQTQKRRELCSYLIVTMTSLLLLVGTWCVFTYYFSFNFIQLFEQAVRQSKDILHTGITFYIFIGSLILILLGIDYSIRKHYQH